MSSPAAARRAASAAAGARPRGGQRVLVPWRLVVGAQYADVALSAYVKVAALAQRAEGCTARVETLAQYLGMSKSSVERGLRQLARADDVDQVVEVLTTRRTLPGGRGQSALRTVRALEDGEDYVWLPVRAAEALTPRQLRVLAILTYAEARRMPLAAADLADMLVHQTGQRAGQPVDERTARRLLDEVAASGWVTLARREGHQGRHQFTVHRSPLHPIPADVSPDTGDGSGPDDQDGSLASREDRFTDRPVPQRRRGIRRRRGDRRDAVDNACGKPRAVMGPGGRALRAETPDAPSATPPASGYTGPGLQLSPRVWDVLAPVHHLLPGIRPYVLREVAREIGRQLDAGTDPRRLHDRLQHRYATNTQQLLDVGRWLLGAGMVRRGRHRDCGLSGCESGVIWHTGQACQVCADLYDADRAQHQVPAAADLPPPPAPVWHECAGCGAPSPRPIPGGMCRPCRPTAAPAA